MTLDGSANASSGTAQLPNLLNGYAIRPSWNVAGVDYAVGVPSGTALKDPSTISMAGVSVDVADHVINVSGNNVTLSGYDFSLNGGWGVSVNSGTNITINDSKFVVGSTAQTPIYVNSSASNVTIKNNIIDGSGSTLGAAGGNAQMLIAGDGAGTTTIEYNLIQNAWGQDIVMSSDVGGENWVVQYNVIENAGEGYNYGAHGDWIQTYNAPGANTNSFACNFNTFVQNIPISEGRTQGISAFSSNSGSNSGGVQTESFNNNTFVATSAAYVNYGIIVDTTRLIGTATIQNNYFDTSGIGSANGGGGNWEFDGDYNAGNGGPYHGAVATSNNANMVTGAYFPQNVTSPPSDPATTSSGSTSSVPSSSPSQGSNLIANGNFTTGDFIGWTLGGNSGSSPWGPQIFMDTNAVDGSKYAAAIGSMGADGTLSQSIATTAGQTYTLSFWLQNEASGTNDFNAIWNGHTLLSLTNAAQSGYTEYTYTVTATGSTSTLQFAAANIAKQWDLDNISLTPGASTTTSSTSPPPDPATTSSGSTSSVPSSSPSQGSNLIANGNFTTGDFIGWTLGGNSGSSPWGPQIFMDTNAVDGSKYAAAIGSMGADGTLSQSIATTVGQTYTLSFWLQNEASGTNDFKATWNGQTLLSVTNAAQSGYTEYTYTVTATSSTSTLQFAAANIPKQWDLDNISLTPSASTTTSSSAAPVISSATDTTSAGTSAVPNMALLVNHMASSFGTTGNDQGGTTGIAQTANADQQSLLTTPQH